MRINPLKFWSNIIKRTTKDQIQKNTFEKEMEAAIQKSEEAMQEISSESLNSETLRALFMPNFKPKTAGRMMAISTKSPNRPVEVAYKINQDDSNVTIDIFSIGENEIKLGSKNFSIIDTAGTKVIEKGSMSSEEQACKDANIKGIGSIEDILQIKYALENGIEKIPCYSLAKATLFHIKMGFKPVQWLTQIHSLEELENIMNKMIKYSQLDIFSKNYTPIIISRGKKQKEYFIDTNTTQCIANIRQIKENYKKGLSYGPRPFIRGRSVAMTLEGENFNTWKQMIENMFSEVFTTKK